MSLTKFEQTGFVARIHIDRPQQLNALNRAVLQELEAHCSSLETALRASDSGARPRVLLLRGSGEKAFVAGADIVELAEADAEAVEELITLGQGVMSRIAALPLVVIAAVDGFALGGGCELALAADLVVAHEGAVFGLPELLLGLIPGFGGTQRLSAKVGPGHAKRLIFSGQKIDAHEAARIGLADYLFPRDDFERELAKLLEEFSSRAPLAISAAKRAIDVCSLEQGLAEEVRLFLETRSSGDAQRGLDAFLNKQKAVFEGD